MKNLILIVLVVLLSAFAFAGSAQAEAFYVPVTPERDGNEVVLSAFPPGTKLLNVQVYNDTTGMRPKNLGPVSRFPLKPDEGFNFTWEGKNAYQELPPAEVRDGKQWQLVTPRSKVGKGLKTVCFTGGKDCKYEWSE